MVLDFYLINYLIRFCSIASALVCFKYYVIDQTTMILLLLSCGYVFIAETLLTPKGPFPDYILKANYIKWIYVFTHSLWHIGIFATAHQHSMNI